MDAGHRAAAGAALVGLAFALDLAVAVPLFGFTLFEATLVGSAAGFLLAALGYAGLHYGHGHGLPALAAGYTLAAASSVAFAVLGVSFPGAGALDQVALVLFALSPLQAAWFALLWWASGGERGEARAAGLRASAGIGVVASALLTWSNVAAGFWAFVPPALMALAGFALTGLSKGLRVRGADEDARRAEAAP